MFGIVPSSFCWEFEDATLASSDPVRGLSVLNVRSMVDSFEVRFSEDDPCVPLGVDICFFAFSDAERGVSADLIANAVLDNPMRSAWRGPGFFSAHRESLRPELLAGWQALPVTSSGIECRAELLVYGIACGEKQL